jgi:hypothetical protein
LLIGYVLRVEVLVSQVAPAEQVRVAPVQIEAEVGHLAHLLIVLEAVEGPVPLYNFMAGGESGGGQGFGRLGKISGGLLSERGNDRDWLQTHTHTHAN